jgi:hypothetical protein
MESTLEFMLKLYTIVEFLSILFHKSILITIQLIELTYILSCISTVFPLPHIY